VQQGFRDAGVADHFVAQAAGNSLPTVAPEHNFLLYVHYAQTGGQAFEDDAAEVRVVK
jgi:hypothetical protein